MIDVWNRVMTNIVTAGGSSIAKVTNTTSNTPAQFPTVSVEQIDNSDAARDLENSENGVNSTIQIQAFSNKSLTEARNVMDIVCDAMRQMGYARTFGPEPLLNMSDTKIDNLQTLPNATYFKREVARSGHLPLYTLVVD